MTPFDQTNTKCKDQNALKMWKKAWNNTISLIDEHKQNTKHDDNLRSITAKQAQNFPWNTNPRAFAKIPTYFQITLIVRGFKWK